MVGVQAAQAGRDTSADPIDRQRRGAIGVRVGNADLAGQDDLVPTAADQVGEHGFAAAGGVAVGGVDAVAAGGHEVLDHLVGGPCVGAVAERHGAQDDRCERLVDTGSWIGCMAEPFRSGSGTGLSGGWPARTAATLSMARMPMASRVASPALAVCGVRTRPSASSSAGLTWGSPSKTSRAAPRSSPFAQGSDERGFVDDSAAGGVDQVGAGFHRGQRRVVDEVAGLRGERGVHRHHVAFGEQGAGVDEGDAVLGGARGARCGWWRGHACRRPAPVARRPSRCGRSRGCPGWRRR